MAVGWLRLGQVKLLAAVSPSWQLPAGSESEEHLGPAFWGCACTKSCTTGQEHRRQHAADHMRQHCIQSGNSLLMQPGLRQPSKVLLCSAQSSSEVYRAFQQKGPKTLAIRCWNQEPQLGTLVCVSKHATFGEDFGSRLGSRDQWQRESEAQGRQDAQFANRR